MLATITVKAFTGKTLHAYLPSIARLRLEVKKEYPFLYQGELSRELDHFSRYASVKNAIAVIVFDKSQIVGAGLGMPLAYTGESKQTPFKEHHLDPEDYFYFSEFYLLPSYRGHGIGHHFFDLREEYAKSLEYSYATLWTPQRPEGDRKKPKGYISTADLWRKRGFVPHHELTSQLSWTDIGDKKPTTKTMIFWIKELL